MSETKISEGVASEHYKVYEEHSKTLKTWLVAYGVGAPVLILSNQTLVSKIFEVRDFRLIAGAFLVGVACQVFSALINKYAMWTCYYGGLRATFQSTKIYKVASWFCDQFWIDILLDVIAIVSMGFATLSVFNQVIPTH